MSLVFELDCLNPKNDKKVYFVNKVAKNGIHIVSLKLKYASVTWINLYAIDELSKALTTNVTYAKKLEKIKGRIKSYIKHKRGD